MKGDRKAFEGIYRRYHQELYRYCLAIVRDREDAEDALQATMAAALRSLPGEERKVALRPWLYRVAHNESISILRGKVPDAGPVELNEQGGGGSAATELERRDRFRQLVVDLRALPDRQRSAIVMRELSDLSYTEIGAALETSEAAARQTVYEARSALFIFREGRDMDCDTARELISDRDGRRLRGRKVRAHLRTCDGCHGFEAAISQRRSDLQALCPPLPALAAAGLLSNLLGGSGGGAAAAGTVGAGTAGAGGAGLLGTGLAGSAAIKGASLIAAVAVAAGAADVGGVIDLPNPLGGNGDQAASEGGGATGAAQDAEGGDPSTSTGGAVNGQGHGVGAHPGSDHPGAGGGQSGANGAAPPHSQAGGNSATAPGQSGTPGNSGSAPGQSGSPGNSATAPGQSESPGNSGSAPGQAGSGNGNSGSAPGQSKPQGGNSGSAPGHSETPPGNSGSAPGHSETSPGNSGSAPGHSETSPGNSGSAPGQSGTSPGNSGSAPGQSGAPPGNSGGGEPPAGSNSNGNK